MKVPTIAIVCGTAVLIGVIVVVLSSNRTPPPKAIDAPEQNRPIGNEEATAVEPAWFEDVAKRAGIDFQYRNGEESNHFTILESLGGGVGLFDYDRDGLLDIFIVGGGVFDAGEPFRVVGVPNRLYRNLGNWQFRDVTAEVGLDRASFYGHGVAIADFDRDGDEDLFLTGYGGWTLYRNDQSPDGTRRFTDVTKTAGLPTPTWATSAAWGDLDGDGWPDLFVCQYVDWSPKQNIRCDSTRSPTGYDVCPPQQFAPLPDFVFRNRGDGTFEDRSAQAGLRKDGKGLGVLICDLNEDGRPDIYVANDATDNFLYMNRGNWKFDEIGFTAGVARDDQGTYDGSMGVDAGDLDGSGRPSIFVTNFENEWHALYRNLGKERFTYASQPFGISSIGQSFVGFGVMVEDLNRDGLNDLLIANGHVIRYPRQGAMAQQPVLMKAEIHNGRRRYVRINGGEYFASDHIGRGLATGDLDNDGKIDVVISHTNQPVAVLRNITTPTTNWAGLRLSTPDHRDVVGSRLTFAQHPNLNRLAKGGGSYLSSSDRRWLIALPGPEEVIGTFQHPTGRDLLRIPLPQNRYSTVNLSR